MTLAKMPFKQRLFIYKWRARRLRIQIGVGWRYATGRTTTGDVYYLHQTAEDVGRCYGLEYLNEASVLDQAIYRWGDAPGLPEMVRRACEWVADRWSSTGHVQEAAADWALDLVERYAAEANVKLYDAYEPVDALP